MMIVCGVWSYGLGQSRTSVHVSRYLLLSKASPGLVEREMSLGQQGMDFSSGHWQSRITARVYKLALAC